MLPIIKEEETRPAALSAGGGSHSCVHDLKLQRRPFHEALRRYAAEQGTWDGSPVGRRWRPLERMWNVPGTAAVLQTYVTSGSRSFAEKSSRLFPPPPTFDIPSYLPENV